jgi:O-antigen/teichoic acid export membrane protein
MATSKIALGVKTITNIFSDESLTKKAYLNAFASGLDYGARLLVGFVVTPFLVAGLGDYFFGMWQILNRLVGYISPASGRPTQALKFTLAHQQASIDYDQKRRHVGSTIIVWMLFLPLMAMLGGVLSWFAPYWLKTPAPFLWYVRWTAGILVANLAMTSLSNIPQSVLEGENLGYKRMGMSTLLVLSSGGLTWLVLSLGWGIIGVAGAHLTMTLVIGVFWLLVVRNYAPWFGLLRPSFKAVRQFLSLSWWFLGWNLIMNLMTASDVVVLGVINSVESVTAYTLTKYAPETVISLVAIMAFGIAPGLGGIIGSGEFKKAASVRGEIMSLTWLVITVLGSTILLWNRAFISLWVGEKHYVGSLPALLIILVIAQFVLIRNDGNVIDLTLRLRRKVLTGALSVALSLFCAIILVGYFKLGIVGLCLGLIIGRFILSISYPMQVGRYLGVSLVSQLKAALRPACTTFCLFLLASGLDRLMLTYNWTVVNGWINLAFSVGLTFLLFLSLSFYVGLKDNQRRQILRRIRAVIAIAPN